MNTQIFYPGLNEFCRKYFVSDTKVSAEDLRLIDHRYKEMKEDIFEHLLLFDQLSFKVYGENIPLVVLLREFGEYAFDALLEQKAINFVLWTPTVLFLEDELPGINSLASGNFNSEAHSDPERSIELGLKWMQRPLLRQRRRQLVKKLAPLYIKPANDLSAKAVETVNSAYTSGKLASFGFASALHSLSSLGVSEKTRLASCATELLEYRFLLEQGMTSYSNYHYFSLFAESVRRVSANNANQFNAIVELEGMPNLRALHGQLDEAWRKLPNIRTSPNARKFRHWLASVENGEERSELTRAYVDSIANAKGLFDSAPAKFSKSIAMTTVGAGLGFAIDHGAVGLGVGAAAGKALEALGGLGLDLLDSFLIEGLTKGWTPRMFLDDLKHLRREPTLSKPGASAQEHN